MCATCGCSDDSKATLTDLQRGTTIALGDPAGHEHDHHVHGHEHHHHAHGDEHLHHHEHPHDHEAHAHHDHSHGDGHAHEHSHGTTVTLERKVLERNNLLAERNRGWLEARKVLALNLVSSPGAGKTTLLERTIRDLGGELPLSVIEGDQQTLNDARRIQAAGCRVVQINTGTACHLEAAMVRRGLEQLDPPPNSVVVIENVGNLVCPALFDLGEDAKVVVSSVTEGDDKPLKYPHMFRASKLVLLNKIDLLPYVQFDVERFLACARAVNPGILVLQLSATRGDGLLDWYAWLREQLERREVESAASSAAAARA
jgi:hydrogenase nickel incorporation protein HypB